MNPEPFKLRFVREIVGTFVLLAMGLLVAGILVAGRSQGWFEEQRRYMVALPDDASSGIIKGSEVYIIGQKIGSVTDVRLTDKDELVAEIRVRGDLVRFIREDSRATVHKKLLGGDGYFDISRGKGEPLPSEGWLNVTIDESLNVLLAKTLKEVTVSAKYTLFQVNSLLAAYTEVAENLENPLFELQAILQDVGNITGGLREGEGTTGQFLKDPELAEEIRQTMASLSRSVDSLGEILDDVKEASAEFPAIAGAIPEMLEQLRVTTREVQKLVEGVQRHWLVRKFVDESPGRPDYHLDPGGIETGEDGP